MQIIIGTGWLTRLYNCLDTVRDILAYVGQYMTTTWAAQKAGLSMKKIGFFYRDFGQLYIFQHDIFVFNMICFVNKGCMQSFYNPRNI